MDYRKIGLKDLNRFADKFEDYTLGEVIYAVTRMTGAKKMSELLDLSDEDISTSINQALYKELE